MRLNVGRTIGMLVLVGLVIPAAMLFGTTHHQQFGVKSKNANWYDTEQATNLLNQMQTLATKTRREVARLQVQHDQLTWQAQSGRLAEARYDVNKMGADLLRLDQMKKGLEPWQRSLVHKVTPEVHEMVYQLDAAIAEVKNHEGRYVLALTQYPQNINVIYKQSNRMAGTIGAVNQYVQAEQKMAKLEHHTAKASS